MSTEKVADLYNASLRYNHPYRNHKLDDHAELLVILDSPPLQASIAGLRRNTYLSRTNVNPTDNMDVFMVKFLGLAQGTAHKWHHIRSTLLHALDKVSRPPDPTDTDNRKELFPLKIYIQGNEPVPPAKLSWGG